MQDGIKYAIVFGAVGTFLTVVMILQAYRGLRVHVTDIERQMVQHPNDHQQEMVEIGSSTNLAENDIHARVLDALNALTSHAVDKRSHVDTDIRASSNNSRDNQPGANKDVHSGKGSHTDTDDNIGAHSVANSETIPCGDGDSISDHNAGDDANNKHSGHLGEHGS